MKATPELDEKNVRSAHRLQDRLRRATAGEVFGRERELDLLDRQLRDDGAVVTFVFGIGGIGKSSLLAAAEPRLSAAGARVLVLDGRVIEPTPRGFLRALSNVLEVNGFSWVEDVAAELARQPAPTVFMVDEFDRLRLLDDWLRHTLLPALPERTRWILAGRFAPRSAWLSTPGWAEAVLSLRLDALDETASREVLTRRGVPDRSVPRLLALARGTPLALTLVASRAGCVESRSAINESAVLDVLAQRSVESLPEALREALEAASVVRRVTRDVLESMLGRPCDDALLNELSELSFIEHTDDGLALHETVRHALSSRLLALDPARHRQLRLAAWTAFERLVVGAAPNGPNAWRLTADMLFVVEHPLVREAFFPSRDSGIAMDVASAEDYPELLALVQQHEPMAWSNIFQAWWQLAPGAFRVARATGGEVLGVTIVTAAGNLPRALADADPLLALWQADLEAGPGRERGALFMRCALSRAQGEALHEVRAAIWLDIKRSYVERPAQWGLYVATRQPERQLPILEPLGFTRTALSHEQERTLRLEFGAAGIWSWLRRLMNSTELGRAELEVPFVSTAWFVDEAARGLVVDGIPVPLSALEYRTIVHLRRRKGRVVSRDELLDAVWEQRHTGSNVVDAVVRLLRKKLGPYAAQLTTVRGHGYRME